MKRSPFFFSVVLLVILSSCAACAAGDFRSGMPWERFSVTLGGVEALSGRNVRIGSSVLGSEVDIDVEDALNLDTTQTSVELTALYRIGESRRHRVSLSYLDIKRRGSTTVEEDIEIGDMIIPAGELVKTSYDTGLLKADHGYSFFMDERFNLAVSGDLFVVPISLGVENKVSGEFNKTDTTAPLPVVGASFDFAISPRWFLRQNLELFYLEYGDLTGGIVDSSLAVEYMGWKHWGLGAAINILRLAVKSESEDEDLPGVDFIGHMKVKLHRVGVLCQVPDLGPKA